MWRLSAGRITVATASGAGARVVGRSCRSRARVFSATGTEASALRDRRRSSGPHRSFHGTHHRLFAIDPTVATRGVADPEDPDDIPDLLDHRFRSLDDGYDDDYGYDYERQQQEEDEREREAYRLRQEGINDELDRKVGRPWRDPWEISEDQWTATDTGPDSIPDWSPSFVSRIAQERLRVLPAEGGEGIPTLEALAAMRLSVSDPSLHPARAAKTYAAYRKSRHFRDVRACVERLAADRVRALLETAGAQNGNDNDNDDWHGRQDTVDELFESLQEEAGADEAMSILSRHPEFPRWVERGLEDYLREAQNERIGTGTGSEGASGGGEEAKAPEEPPEEAPGPAGPEEGTPVFMDCYDASEASPDGSSPGPMVPSILSPLAPHRHGGPGKMVEEWELAAHPTTKRILLRDCTSRIAGILASERRGHAQPGPRIYVHGTRGTGKSAVLASIVASARKSGCIVMYLPDGDRLRKNGFFVTPSTHPDRAGMFDLQDLSREALEQLADSHATDLEGMVAGRETLEQFFKEAQLEKMYDRLSESAESAAGETTGVSLNDLVGYAREHKKHAPMCYSAVLCHLTKHQTEKKFVLVMDEFNCLFDHHGHYFHMAYDEHVREAIPCHRINLFEPILAAMNISNQTAEQEEDAAEAGPADSENACTASVVVGTTESHAVRRATTDALTECAERRAAGTADENFHVVEVPRFSSLEADHVLANFEAIGIGKLRLDRGDTLMNPQEVEFLKMASGSVGQKLLDASIL